MAIKLTVRERCANCGTIHTRREGDWIIEDTCLNPPPGPKCPPARWRASEVTWLPDQVFIDVMACKACGKTALSVTQGKCETAVRITDHKCAGGFDLRERLPVTGIRLS